MGEHAVIRDAIAAHDVENPARAAAMTSSERRHPRRGEAAHALSRLFLLTNSNSKTKGIEGGNRCGRVGDGSDRMRRSLSAEVRQTGATNIVSSLHQVPIGRMDRSRSARAAGDDRDDAVRALAAHLVGRQKHSPIPDAVKRKGWSARRGSKRQVASLHVQSRPRRQIVCYNFMPVVDWTRTDLNHGSTPARRRCVSTTRSSPPSIFSFCSATAPMRPTPRRTRRAPHRLRRPCRRATSPTSPVTSPPALPSSTTEPLTIPEFRDRLAAYASINAARLRQHLIEFLEAVAPVAKPVASS